MLGLLIDASIVNANNKTTTITIIDVTRYDKKLLFLL